MLYAICSEIKNFFTRNDDRLIGDWEIVGGTFAPPITFPTDYIRIVGSRLNDGVYKVSEMTLKDEVFHGAVWLMSPPADFLELVGEIKAWQDKNGGVDSAAMSPFASESFGGYSYTKGQGSASGANVPTWESTYASRLNIYRRIREL